MAPQRYVPTAAAQSGPRIDAAAASTQSITTVLGGTTEDPWAVLGTGGQIGVIIAAIIGLLVVIFGGGYLIILLQRWRTGHDWLSDLEERDRQHVIEREETERWLLSRSTPGHSRQNSETSSSDKVSEGDKDLIYILPSSPDLARPRSHGELRRPASVVHALRHPRSMGALGSHRQSEDLLAPTPPSSPPRRSPLAQEMSESDHRLLVNMSPVRRHSSL